MSQIADLLAASDCRLLTLTGAGGIGKTRLAMQAAAQARQFEHGVYFVPLTAINSADLVSTAIASVLQVNLSASQDFRAQITRFLRAKQVLLVLDNFEHVLDAAELLSELLGAAPALKCLVTSRGRLNLREEWVVTLEGLAFPKDDDSEPVERYSAVQLFVQRARQMQANFMLTENLQSVQTICQRVEGMPLAIELAVTWLRAMPCRQIATQLEASANFLTTPLRNIPERPRSMHAVFEQSWTLLSAVEREALMGLSVFRGGFDWEAAEQVVGASLPVLASLADKSMIRLNAAERYDLHELLRQFAADKLAEAGATQTAHQRHCDYFLKLAEAAAEHNFGSEQIAWYDRLETEFDNLRVAVFWSMDSEISLRITGALGWFFSERSHWGEGLDWLDRAVAANPDAAPSIRSRALHSAAALAALTGGADQRVPGLCDEAFSLARAVGDRWNMAWALCHKGNYGYRGLDDSIEYLDASLALFREIEDPMGLTHTLIRRSWRAREKQDYVYQESLVKEAGVLAQESGDSIMMGWVTHELGTIAWNKDKNLEEAKRQFLKALEIFRKARFGIGHGHILVMLAMVEQELGNIGKAQTLYKDSLLSMWETYRTNRFMQDIFARLIRLAMSNGQFERAAIIAGIARSSTFAASAELEEFAFYEKEEAVLREYFGSAVYAQFWSIGQAMTFKRAIAFFEEDNLPVVIAPADGAAPLVTPLPQSLAEEPLTERELEILQALAEGLNSREIADRLVLSVSTIRWYLKHIYGKLDAHSRSQAIARARELRLLA